VNATLALLLSDLYGSLAPAHLADLRKSGLSDATIRQQKIRSVPLDLLEPLLGFDPARVRSAYLIPFAAPGGGWMNHVRMKVAPTFRDARGATVKYLQPKRSGVRVFFPVATLPAVRHAAAPLYVVEVEKKALAVAQTGLPTIGICGIQGWHRAGETTLHPDLDDVGLDRRIVYLIPDADYHTNPAVGRAVKDLAAACAALGAASVRIVQVPADCHGIDDYLVKP
jgi:hypothetical protein